MTLEPFAQSAQTVGIRRRRTNLDRRACGVPKLGAGPQTSADCRQDADFLAPKRYFATRWQVATLVTSKSSTTGSTSRTHRGAWEERSARSVRSRQRQSPTRKGAEDWISASAAASTHEPLPIRRVLRRHPVLLAAALVIVVCLLGGLAAAGVFSGGHQYTAPAKTSTLSVPTTTTTPQVTPTQRALTAPPAPLMPGDHGAPVRLLQRALAQLGYPLGTNSAPNSAPPSRNHRFTAAPQFWHPTGTMTCTER